MELKKKIINLQDEFNEKVFNLEKDVNTLKQDIMLKNNVIINLEGIKSELTGRVQ